MAVPLAAYFTTLGFVPTTSVKIIMICPLFRSFSSSFALTLNSISVSGGLGFSFSPTIWSIFMSTVTPLTVYVGQMIDSPL